MNTHTLSYAVRYEDGGRLSLILHVNDLKDADCLAEIAAAERSAARVTYVELDTSLAVPGHEGMWRSGSCFGFFDEEGYASDPHPSFKDAQQAAHDHLMSIVGEEAAWNSPEHEAYLDRLCEIDLYPPTPASLPWGTFALMTLVSLVAAVAVCHFTGYVWWFPVGMATYTVASVLCYAALGLDNDQDASPTQETQS